MRWVGKLERWIREEEGMSVSEWLRRANIPKETFYGWKRGKVPTLRYARLIEELTGGYVTVGEIADEVGFSGEGSSG